LDKSVIERITPACIECLLHTWHYAHFFVNIILFSHHEKLLKLVLIETSSIIIPTAQKKKVKLKRDQAISKGNIASDTVTSLEIRKVDIGSILFNIFS
jgi:hypothetical protein